MRASRRERKTIFDKAVYKKHYERKLNEYFMDISARNVCIIDPEYMSYFEICDFAADRALVDTFKKARRRSSRGLHQDGKSN